MKPTFCLQTCVKLSGGGSIQVLFSKKEREFPKDDVETDTKVFLLNHHLFFLFSFNFAAFFNISGHQILEKLSRHTTN